MRAVGTGKSSKQTCKISFRIRSTIGTMNSQTARGRRSLTADGNLRRKKGVRRRHGCCDEVCKQDFPKTRQLNDNAEVICPGIARKYGLTVKGRRNALGLVLAKRVSAV